MEAIRYESWPLPYLAEVKPLIPGETVQVTGRITGKSFDINLQQGPGVDTSKHNVILHMGVRPHDKTIVLNSRKLGHDWEKEHRIHDALQEGETFDIRIRAMENEYEIFINQRDEAKYTFRQPLANITHLLVDGALDLYSVHLGGKFYPLPYKVGIDTFAVGNRVCLSGVPRDDRFVVDLVTNDAGDDTGDIALKFDVRLSEPVIIRSCRKNGQILAEEREGNGKFPFHKDQAFDLIIVNEAKGFFIFINGRKFGEFAHRLEPNAATGVCVYGDLELQGIHVA